MELFRLTSQEGLRSLLNKLKQEQWEREQRMAAFYNFDFRQGVPQSFPVSGRSSALPHPGPRFIWEPMHPMAATQENDIGAVPDLESDPRPRQTTDDKQEPQGSFQPTSATVDQLEHEATASQQKMDGDTESEGEKAASSSQRVQ